MSPKKTTKKVAAKKTTKKKEDNYKLKITVNAREFKTEGETVLEALLKFVNDPEFPFGAKTNAIFNLSKGKKETMVRWPVMMARRKFRLMNNKDTVVEILAAKLTLMLNE